MCNCSCSFALIIGNDKPEWSTTKESMFSILFISCFTCSCSTEAIPPPLPSHSVSVLSMHQILHYGYPLHQLFDCTYGGSLAFPKWNEERSNTLRKGWKKCRDPIELV
mmetsp:Transcript_20790/g.41988  ORF Transcript_20790/g.41988 Transcript_20790/m.41988 type:complete len:108 (-) Transcript_20790:91-414(-)